ncbi:MAG: radical SAM protein [Proteobacteria bacterium]|nr:radical SAM protein [Pseudomonadota bacterium]
MKKTLPGYKKIFKSGELKKRADAFWKIMSSCTLCPWQCGIDRTKGEKGRCQAPGELKVARAIAHFGEEPVLSGTKGSGTIFFTHCHLHCCFCQNYQISQEGLGETITIEDLARNMLSLQETGCHNINLVSPTHYLPHIVQALCIAAAKGLSLPLVYNSNGYESVETLRLLSGIVDIYLPDAKYGEDALAKKYSRAHEYTRVNEETLLEMYAQVGPLVINDQGLAVRGLIIRHLVLPDDASRTAAVLNKIKNRLGPHVHISLMGQYLPVFEAHTFPEIDRRPSPEEYNYAVESLIALEFENGWLQQQDSIDGEFLPDFEKSDSWN